MKTIELSDDQVEIIKWAFEEALKTVNTSAWTKSIINTLINKLEN